jgi:hypothetical protein
MYQAMRTLSTKLKSLCVITAAAAPLCILGCEQSDKSHSEPPPPMIETGQNPGGAPTFGTPSGMGFSTGDAAHSGGQGGGLMGYNHTGAAGTSGTITDARTDLRDESRGVIVEPPKPETATTEQ